MTQKQFDSLVAEAKDARILVQGDKELCFLSRPKLGATIYSGCHYSAAKKTLEEFVKKYRKTSIGKLV